MIIYPAICAEKTILFRTGRQCSTTKGTIIPAWLTRVLSPILRALIVRFPGSAGVATRLPTMVDTENLRVAPLSVPATPRARLAVETWPCLFIPWGKPMETYEV